MKILYIPIDERPCNYKYPNQIASCQDSIELNTIPKELLGNKKVPANTFEISSYLLQNIKDYDVLICSIDMICYGGLLPSRLHNMDFEQLNSNLKVLKEIKKLNEKIKIYPFVSIMRTPAYSSSDEEPDYYELYGKDIFNYKYLNDKLQKDELTKEQHSILNNIKIPQEVLTDYENRRKVNIKLVEETLKYLKEEMFEQLTIFQDDSAPYGYTALDQEKIKNKISKEGLSEKVNIYPGADEVGSTLLLKAYNDYNKIKNKVYVEYTSLFGPNIIPLYEDRVMYETLKWHLYATNSVITKNENEADYILIVNSPGELMQESWDQFTKRDITYDKNRNLTYMVEKIALYIKYNKKVIIADAAYANGGDFELVKLLDKYDVIDKIYAYSGWNTHANTLGTALAQGMIINTITPKVIQNNISHILEDCFYQSKVRMDITNELLPKLELNYFDLKDKQQEVIKSESKIIKDLYEDLNISNKYPIKNLTISHPWNRMFEIDLDVEVENKFFKKRLFELSNIKNSFITSVQALEDEPLHSSFIMSKMAKAVVQGGAGAIRANTKEDIVQIKNEVNVPVIGIVKKDYDDSNVYITPTIKEVEDLISAQADVIALDATTRIRPNNQTLDQLIKEIKNKYPQQILMADCSTKEECIKALELGFDIISSTLVGYTEQSKNLKIEENDFQLIKEMLKLTKDKNKFFIAEGNINTYEKVKRVFEIGVDAVVVGSMITRPQLITKKFTANMADEFEFINIDFEQNFDEYKNKNIICISSKKIDYMQDFIINNELFSNILISEDDQIIAYKSGYIIKRGLKSIAEAKKYLIDNKYIEGEK